jgi:hypothetical protein
MQSGGNSYGGRSYDQPRPNLSPFPPSHWPNSPLTDPAAFQKNRNNFASIVAGNGTASRGARNQLRAPTPAKVYYNNSGHDTKHFWNHENGKKSVSDHDQFLPKKIAFAPPVVSTTNAPPPVNFHKNFPGIEHFKNFDMSKPPPALPVEVQNMQKPILTEIEI